mgnify:CR=1 FL=1
MRKAAAMETGTKYKSKIDRAFYIKVLVTLLLGIGLLVFYFIFRNVIVGILGTWMFVALLLIFLPEYRSTYYIIRDNGLLVKNGLFDKVTILYRQMMEVAEEQGEARHGSSKVALSKDRLYIRYRVKKKEYWMAISPENKEQFLEEIQEILARCEMSEIYIVNPYECFLLMCLLTDCPLAVFSEIWELEGTAAQEEKTE